MRCPRSCNVGKAAWVQTPLSRDRSPDFPDRSDTRKAELRLYFYSGGGIKAVKARAAVELGEAQAPMPALGGVRMAAIVPPRDQRVMTDHPIIIVPRFHYGCPDIYDGTPWSEDDVTDLRAAIENGSTPEEAAGHLCRAGSADDVMRKAAELGLRWQHDADRN